MPRTERKPVEAFQAVFEAIERRAADQVALVGGHAVNVWALTYADRLGARLDAHQPLTSGDMDVYGTRNALLALHDALGGKLLLSGPREITDGTLILGVEPDTREIDVLRHVNGIPKIETDDSVLLEVCGHHVPVLFPHLLLRGKIENAIRLDQSERQDLKHVRVLALVLREFLTDVVNTATPENEKAALVMMQKTLDVVTSESARMFEQRHGLTFQDVFPVQAMMNSPLKKLVGFAQHELPRRLGPANDVPLPKPNGGAIGRHR